ncbi:hypothetical protein LTR06_011091 [Exophiala xenobiotica]|nr:hypothetical protein LTR06_011091 [Exophiala xenobiotica]
MGLKSPNGTFEKVDLNLASDQAYQNLTHQPSCDYPLAIFMPAEATTRLWYGQIASTIASNGYIVVSIDAPYDVDVVEYPRRLPGTLQLDTLGNYKSYRTGPDWRCSGTPLAARPPTRSSSKTLGSWAAWTWTVGFLVQDKGQANHTRNITSDLTQTTWAAAWPNITGWKRDVTVTGMLHYDFSDYLVVFETLGITPGVKVATNPNGILLRPMKGTRALQIITSYVTTFLDFVIFGKCSTLLEGPVNAFPEVTLNID